MNPSEKRLFLIQSLLDERPTCSRSRQTRNGRKSYFVG